MRLYRVIKRFFCTPLKQYIPIGESISRWEHVTRLVIFGNEYEDPEYFSWILRVEPPPLGTTTEWMVLVASYSEDASGNVSAGATGVQGPQGSQGQSGVRGVQGWQGSQGNQGLQGLQGNRGFQGLRGPQGNQGNQGFQGIGNTGIDGTQGTQGFRGVQGIAGTLGLQGNQGSQGSQGSQGLQGWLGNQGGQGFQGIGNTGIDGAQGWQGFQGSDSATQIVLVLDGGGAQISTGVKGWVRVPFACTLTGWELTADQSGDIVIDVWKSTYAGFPPIDAGAMPGGGHEPNIPASGTKNQDTDLSDWITRSITAGDYLRFNVDSCSTITYALLALTYSRP